MIQLDSSLRLLVVASCLGLTVGACEIAVLGSDAREMAYPGGSSEALATTPAHANASAAEPVLGVAVFRSDATAPARPFDHRQ
ncbi:MAG TPA: hypothetical protein VGO85_16765 [Caldimonas sp.]|jgi:hypothetical protein|nr:hypothetical protein [Caldimonas sp.]